jgi:dihydrofolate synthase/folylpolyglutamate synthase
LTTRWPENRIEPSLARIAAVVDLLGDPQRTYPVIHVTGTNGKTSTARMIEALLRALGLRTGLFTSPHLLDPRERICFDGQPISAGRFLRTWDDISPFIELVDKRSVADGGIPLSFFEVMTALAFAAFADAPVDVAIVEVGMGGAWDATNVADGMVAVVTPIDIDHVEYLGETVAMIALEKAGIIKADAFVVLAQQELAAAEVLLARSVEMAATVAREGLEFGVLTRGVAVGGQVLTLKGLRAEYEDVFLPLFGEHQGTNAAVAVAAVEAFIGGGNEELDIDIVREGFALVSSPGRLEIVRRNPTVILDAAHNPHGARALATAIADSFDFAQLFAIVGVMNDKDAAGILTALEPVVDRVIVTESTSGRAMPGAALTAIASSIFGADRVWTEPELLAAVDRAFALAEESGEFGGVGVLVTGSVALVGDAKRLYSAR